MTPRAARAILLVAACGAAAATTLRLAGGSDLAFLAGNEMAWPARLHWIGAIAGGAVAAFVFALFHHRRRGEESLARLSRRLSPLLLSPFALGLVLHPGVASPLAVAVMITLTVLLLERQLLAAFERAPPPALEIPPLPAAAVVLLVAVAYAAYMSTFALFRHWRFETFGFDLGQLDNVFWSTIHGRPFQNAPLGLPGAWRELGNHFDPTILVLLPFYALREGAETLLVMQSIGIALGMFPLYRFARRRLSTGASLVLVGAYAFYAPLHGANSYDFHMQPIAATLVLAGIDFVDERRFGLGAVALALALGCREDVSAGVALLGLFLALSGHRVRAGVAIAVASGIYFVTVRFFVMPAFGSWVFAGHYGELLPADRGDFAGIVATVLSNPIYTASTLVTPDKVRYLLQILAPLAFLPVRRSWLVPSLLPAALFTVFTSHGPTTEISFQYSALFVPYVFPAAAVALAAFGDDSRGVTRRRVALISVSLATLLTTAQWGAFPPRSRYQSGFYEVAMRPPTAAHRRKAEDLRELVRELPADVAIAASERLIPHLSRRLEIYSLRDESDRADVLLWAEEETRDGAERGRRAVASGEFAIVDERPSGLVKAVRRAPSRRERILDRLEAPRLEPARPSG